MDNKKHKRQLSYFEQLPRCTQDAIVHSIMQQREERTLSAAKRRVAQQQHEQVTSGR